MVIHALFFAYILVELVKKYHLRWNTQTFELQDEIMEDSGFGIDM